MFVSTTLMKTVSAGFLPLFTSAPYVILIWAAMSCVILWLGNIYRSDLGHGMHVESVAVRLENNWIFGQYSWYYFGLGEWRWRGKYRKYVGSSNTSQCICYVVLFSVEIPACPFRIELRVSLRIRYNRIHAFILLCMHINLRTQYKPFHGLILVYTYVMWMYRLFVWYWISIEVCLVLSI